MGLRKSMKVMSLVVCVVLYAGSGVLAGVSPGEVIDQKNCSEVKGLVPDAVMGWLEKGDIKIQVGELEYDPRDYRPELAKGEFRERNKGRYDVNDEEMIIEKKTGEVAPFIVGIPFPEAEETDFDVSDPKAAVKMIYNKTYYTYVGGNQRFPSYVRWVARGRGLERTVRFEWQQYPLDGLPDRKTIKNPEGYERFSLLKILAPFDVAGSNILLMRYRGTKADTTLAYLPAIRRVRRMSPANRSDSFVGSDICIDDAWLFDGKVIDFDWKFLRKQEALLPFLGTKVVALEKNPQGGYLTTKGIKQVHYGYDTEGWTGAPWMPTNLVWVKRPTYVLQVTPKDAYYNYGMQELWMDSEVAWMGVFKVIHDRAGNYWKTVWYSYSGAATPDGEKKVITGTTLLCGDERTDHGTVIAFPEPDNQWNYEANLNRGDYSLGGFQALCK